LLADYASAITLFFFFSPPPFCHADYIYFLLPCCDIFAAACQPACRRRLLPR